MIIQLSTASAGFDNVPEVTKIAARRGDGFETEIKAEDGVAHLRASRHRCGASLSKSCY
jgi:hypothetical protein